MSSKLSFRSRQVDYTKPLPIYFTNDVPDLADMAAINRSVPQMPTGMEKDEESEHHLQRALSALQAFGACAATSSNEYAIPTPKVDVIDNKLYDRIYSTHFPKLKQYIRIQPFSNDYDYPDYDADYDDEDWLNEQRSKIAENFCDDLVLFFENIIDRLEKATGHSTNLMSRDEAKMLLTKENAGEDAFRTSPIKAATSAIAPSGEDVTKTQKDEFILCIYEYWKAKRLKYKHPLTPIVLTDKSGVVTQPNNPYLVFRRRTEKMQTRKNRKTEEQSYEKMLILKRDLIKAQQILKVIKQRESLKKELLKLTLETFEKRFKLNDFDGHVTESIKSSIRPASSIMPSSSNYYANALTALANSSNPQLLANFQNRINNINKNNSGSSGVASSIERTIATIIGSNKFKGGLVGSAPSTNFKRHMNYEDNQITVSTNKKRTKEQRARTGSVSSNSVNSLLTSSNHLKKSSPPQAGAAMGSAFKKPPPLTVNQLTSCSPPASSLSTKSRLIRRLASNRSVDSSSLVTAPADLQRNSEKSSAANYYLIECNEYDEELRLHDINNLDAMLSETQNKLSTSVEKDGYWCFKRKEGCRYLAQTGSIFKHDAFDELPADSLEVNRKRKHTRDLQHHYYGYAVDAKGNRHLGLVRRRMGRGGRVLLERITRDSVEKLLDPVTTKSTDVHAAQPPPPPAQEAFTTFKTYYPLQSACVDQAGSTIFAVVPNINSKRLKLMEDDSTDESSSESNDERDSESQYNHRHYLSQSYEYDASRTMLKRSRSANSSLMEDEDADRDDSIGSDSNSDSSSSSDEDEDELETGPTVIRLRQENNQSSQSGDDAMVGLTESRRRQALKTMVRLRHITPVTETDGGSAKTEAPSPKRVAPISPPTPPPSSSSSSSSSSTSSIPPVITNGYPGSPVNRASSVSVATTDLSYKMNSSVFYSSGNRLDSDELPSATPNNSTNGPPKVLSTASGQTILKQEADISHNYNHLLLPILLSPSPSSTTNNLTGQSTNIPVTSNNTLTASSNSASSSVNTNSATSSSASPSSSTSSTSTASSSTTAAPTNNATLLNIIQPDLVT